jgi:hypothetical protein
MISLPLATTDEGIDKVIGVIQLINAIDKRTGEASPACRDAVCQHKYGACAYNSGVECIKNHEGRLLLIHSDRNRNRLPEVYEMNPDTYELSVYLTLDENLLFFEVLGDSLVYAHLDSNDGKGGWASLDLATGETRELIDRLSYRPYIGTQDRSIYLTTTELELLRVNLDTGETARVADECRDLAVHRDKLYYLRYDLRKGYADLYAASLDGSGETMLIDGVDSFQPYGDWLYYANPGRQLVKTGLDGRGAQTLFEGLGYNYYFLLLPGVDWIIADARDGYVRMDFDGGNPTPLYDGLTY